MNTGLTGGPHGVGSRFKISHTREIITSILNGDIDKSEFVQDEIFGFGIPKTLGNIPSNVIHPQESWLISAYKAQLTQLAENFKANFKKYEEGTDAEIIAGGPRI